MSARDLKAMVAEDDPQWCRFWNLYPRRCSKKDARAAWTKLKPTPAQVDRMIAALEWQVPHFRWDREKVDYAPYPASWLNGERWNDERPGSPQPRGPLAGLADDWIESIGYCFHRPKCEDDGVCREKRRQERMRHESV